MRKRKKGKRRVAELLANEFIENLGEGTASACFVVGRIPESAAFHPIFAMRRRIVFRMNILGYSIRRLGRWAGLIS